MEAGAVRKGGVQVREVALPAIEQASVVWGVAPSDVLSSSRSQSIADARHLAIWLVRRKFGFSYPELGRIFGRDHTTCIHSVRVVERAIKTGRPLMLAEAARGTIEADTAGPRAGKVEFKK